MDVVVMDGPETVDPESDTSFALMVAAREQDHTVWHCLEGDAEVRARIDTGNFSEFLAVQQELLLLLYEIVEATGTGFAFPSTTAYIADDTGLPEALDDAILRPSVNGGPTVPETVPSDEFTRDDSAVLTDDDGAASEGAD